MAHTHFSIVIPTRNRAEVLSPLLQQLADQIYPKDAYEVLIIDNAPTDKKTHTTVERLSKKNTSTRFRYHSISQKGVSPARNEGAKKAKYSHLIFIDDDSVVKKYFLAGYEHVWKKYPNSKVIGGSVQAVKNDGQPLTKKQQQMLNPLDGWCFGHISPGKHDLQLYPGGAVGSGNMSYLKNKKESNLFEVHLESEPLPGWQFGSEDVELCQRVLLRGQKIIFSAESNIVIQNRIDPDRFTQKYLNTRYWQHGMELAVVEAAILKDFPDSCPLYRGFLIWDLTHISTFPKTAWKFLTRQQEWIRLFSYLLNGPFLIEKSL